MKGYKQAIRERMPSNWVFVLKYLGRLDAWIELVYDTRFRPINHHWNRKQQKELKKKALHDLLNGSFYNTLDEQRMDEARYRTWLRVDRWIDWFNKNYLFIKAEYENLRHHSNLLAYDIIKRISANRGISEKFVSSIIEYIKKDERNERI